MTTTIRYTVLMALLLIAACAQPEADQAADAQTADEPAPATMLPSGVWTGGLSPMNHPEQVLPLAFDVNYAEGAVSITIEGPDGVTINTRGARVDGDTLRFVFIEPEMFVPLRCALGDVSSLELEGRCADNSGKWAAVTMTPPAG